MRTGCSTETETGVSTSTQHEVMELKWKTLHRVRDLNPLLCHWKRNLESSSYQLCISLKWKKKNSLRLKYTPGNTEFKFISPYWLRTSINLHEKSSRVMVHKFWKKQNPPCSEGRISKSRVMRVFYDKMWHEYLFWNNTNIFHLILIETWIDHWLENNKKSWLNY